MSITFECNACGADYDLEIPAIIERPNSLKCPNCGAHPPAHRSHAFATALEDLLAAMAAIRKKLRFEIELETDDMPPPYGPFEDASEAGIDLESEDGVAPEEEEEEEEEEEPVDAPPVRGRTPAAKPAPVAKGRVVDDDDDDLAEGDDDDDDDEDDEDEDEDDEFRDLDDEDEDDEDEDEDDEEDEDEDDDEVDSDDDDDEDDEDEDEDEDDKPKSKKPAPKAAPKKPAPKAPAKPAPKRK